MDIEELLKYVDEKFNKISETFLSNAQYIYSIEERLKKLEEEVEK